VRVEVRPIGAGGLKRNNTTGTHIFSVQQRLKGFQYGSIGSLRQQAHQCAFTLEQTAHYAQDGKRPVTVRDGGEDFSGKFFSKEDGAFGLAAGAKLDDCRQPPLSIVCKIVCKL
jgi:hypothetical protein